MDAVIEKISKVMGREFSEEQLRVLEHKGGMNITACAGAGKTTVLVALLTKRILTGEIHDTNRLLVTTYSVAGREELQARVNDLLMKMGLMNKVEIRTLHSSYYKLLKSLGKLGKIGSNMQRTVALAQAMKKCNVRLEDDDTKTLDSLLSYQINNMMSDEMLYNDYHFTLDMDMETYTKVRKAFAIQKAEMGFMDFDDLQLQLFVMLKDDENIRRYVSSVWDYFYIDEFQDVSKLQYQILKYMLRDPKNLVVIGDDDQCIYEWRGADPNIILNVCGTYDIERFILSTNYRCGGEIVKRANVGIQNNNNRYIKQMRPYNDGGNINVLYTRGESYYEMSKLAMDKIRELLLSGVREEDISILCRNNAHGIIIDNMLSAEGIVHRASEDVQFHKNSVARDLKACIEIGMNTFNFNYVSNNLWKMAPYMSANNAGIVGRIMKDACCNFLQALKTFLVKYCCYADDDILNDGVKEVDVTLRNVYSTRISGDTANELFCIYKDIRDSDDTSGAKNMIKRYKRCTAGFLYKSEDSLKMLNGICKYMESLLDTGYEYYSDIMKKTETLSEFEISSDRRCINLSTMHGSKGKEWKHVIMLGVDGYSCPAIDRMQILMSDGIDSKSLGNFIEQERRLYYVAVTRAKEELTFITDLDNMSPFLLETLGIIKKDDYTNKHIRIWANNGGYTGSEIDKYIELISKEVEVNGKPSEDCDNSVTSYISDGTEVFDENFSSREDTSENMDESVDDDTDAEFNRLINCEKPESINDIIL